MEDIKFIGGIRFGTTLSDKACTCLSKTITKRVDWGLTYYRSNVTNYYGFFDPKSALNNYDNVVITNLYQVNVAYPLSRVNSIALLRE